MPTALSTSGTVSDEQETRGPWSQKRAELRVRLFAGMWTEQDELAGSAEALMQLV